MCDPDGSPGYEDVNDAKRLWRDPAMRYVVGGRAVQRGAGFASQIGRFETEWLTCESCHPAIFPYRDIGLAGSEDYGITMDQVFEGEYCGKCHGTVAFALDSCNRCHKEM